MRKCKYHEKPAQTERLYVAKSGDDGYEMVAVGWMCPECKAVYWDNGD